jgi:hypothetical protein
MYKISISIYWLHLDLIQKIILKHGALYDNIQYWKIKGNQYYKVEAVLTSSEVKKVLHELEQLTLSPAILVDIYKINTYFLG